MKRLAALLGLLAGLARAELPPEVAAELARAGVPRERVAVFIQPLDAAEPVLTHNPDAALNPASAMKLVTSFAALDQLGPAWTWRTPVWLEGGLAGGTLSGNLVVQGRGDPTLTLERLWLLQRELRLSGVRHVRGGLVLDTAYFDLDRADPGTFDGVPLAPYNAQAGALVANYNAFPLRFERAGGGVRAVPELAPPGFVLDSALTPEPGDCEQWRDDLALTPLGGGALRLEGPFPEGCGERVRAFNLFPPEVTFDYLFRALWAEGGGGIVRVTESGAAPERAPDLEFVSPPLAEALRAQNKYSNNVMTRNLFLSLGAARFGAPARPDKGERAVREALARHGLPLAKLVVDNGAGLSRIARVSARLLGGVLRAAANQPWGAEFESALPIAGRDGTLRRRFANTPVAGQAHLKTGSLRDVSALAGYVRAASGRKFAFVMLVNHRNAGEVVPAQQALLEWLIARGG